MIWSVIWSSPMKINHQKVVVITGASSGIGHETAVEFARKGCDIVLAARRQERLEQVAREIETRGGNPFVLKTDVSVEEDCRALIQKTVEHFGRIDVLVNNAGYGHYAPIEKLSTEDLEKILKTNLFGALWCTQAALPHMIAQKSGHIVNVSTVISLRAVPFMSAYCISKFAMNAFDESLALEARPHNIGVSLVCPGLTKTKFQTNASQVGHQAPVGNEKGMTPSKVARAILRSVQKNRRRVYLTWGGKILILFQRISPFLTDQCLYLAYFKLIPLLQKKSARDKAP